MAFSQQLACYLYQILNEHGESIDKTESGENLKNIFADLYYISVCMVIYSNVRYKEYSGK